VIKLTVNGKIEETDKKNILEYLNSKNVVPEKVVIEHNGKIIKRNELGNISLNENDILEVIRFVGGG
jgi:sulfur carrier protein